MVSLRADEASTLPRAFETEPEPVSDDQIAHIARGVFGKWSGSL
jgi:hypothetical protein